MGDNRYYSPASHGRVDELEARLVQLEGKYEDLLSEVVRLQEEHNSPTGW